jgi:hypothetical protein
MKTLSIALFLLLYGQYAIAQKVTRLFEIDAMAKNIDYLKSNTDSIVRNDITYTFLHDSSQQKLFKVIVKGANDKPTQHYYFNNEQLFFIRGGGFYYFFDQDFSTGSTWKNEEDLGMLQRERQIATAYRLLLMYKRHQLNK